MIYPDPSELRSSSKFGKCMKGVNRHSSPGLEEATGADVLIGVPGLPHPTTPILLKRHISAGALLVQIKFGFDLFASIFDGRYKASQAKMLATGASPDQVILLFVGIVLHSKKDKLIVMNGQWMRDMLPMAKNFTYDHYLEQRLMWGERGGIFEVIEMESRVKDWFVAAENVMEKCRNEPVKTFWKPQQKLALIDDWRNILINIPGIGEKHATAIYNKLETKSWRGFMSALESGRLLEIPGIGSGIIEKIKEYLK